MHPALVRRLARIVCVLLAAAGPAPAQATGGEPLRKTDLVRLLTVGTLAQDQLAALVRGNCLSFTPTNRDRADLVALGADSGLLREVDSCARRAALAQPVRPAVTAPQRTPPAPRRPANRVTRPTEPSATPAPPARVEPRPAPRTPAAAHTAFVLGLGQRGVVGTGPGLPLVFEVRDTAGAPVVGETVTLGATNGQLAVTHVVTDSNGRVQVNVRLGPKVGLTVVRATVGAIQREATLQADPGPVARLVLRCGDTPVERKVALTQDVPAILRVTGQDAFGNAVPLAHLQAATGDKSVLRVVVVGGDSLDGLVQVTPREPGSTSLVVVASGQREDLTAVVLQKRDTSVLCPRPG